MNGWIKLPRSIINHWLWQDAERFKWWCDLLMLAAWEDRKTMHDAHVFVLTKGQMIASVSFLTERWGKSAPTIIKYLKLLEDEGMIKRTVLYRQTSIITICKYESYTEQDDMTLYTQVDTKVNTIVDSIVYTNKENKESKEVKKNSLTRVTPARKVFQKPTIKEVEDYITERGYIFDASAFWNFYESNGWKVGKNPMKNWKAACSTWNVKEKQFQSKDKRNGSNNDHPTNEQLIKQTYELINESAARAEAGYYDDTRLPF